MFSTGRLIQARRAVADRVLRRRPVVDPPGPNRQRPWAVSRRRRQSSRRLSPSGHGLPGRRAPACPAGGRAVGGTTDRGQRDRPCRPCPPGPRSALGLSPSGDVVRRHRRRGGPCQPGQHACGGRQVRRPGGSRSGPGGDGFGPHLPPGPAQLALPDHFPNTGWTLLGPRRLSCHNSPALLGVPG